MESIHVIMVIELPVVLPAISLINWRFYVATGSLYTLGICIYSWVSILKNNIGQPLLGLYKHNIEVTYGYVTASSVINTSINTVLTIAHFNFKTFSKLKPCKLVVCSYLFWIANACVTLVWLCTIPVCCRNVNFMSANGFCWKNLLYTITSWK